MTLLEKRYLLFRRMGTNIAHQSVQYRNIAKALMPLRTNIILFYFSLIANYSIAISYIFSH